MATPGQNLAAGTPQADTSTGAAFLTNTLFNGDHQVPPQQVPPQQVPPQQVPPQQVPPQQVPPQQVPPQQVPPQQVPPQQVPPQQVPPQQAVTYKFGDRYGAEQPEDPLANLQELQAPAPMPEIQAPQNMNESQNHAWAGLRAQVGQAVRKANEYLAKYNELVASTKKVMDEKSGFGEQLNAKDKEIADLRNELGQMDLKRSPEFQDKYDKPIFAVRDDIARTLVDNGMQEQDAMSLAQRILDSNRNDIPGLVSQLPSYAQGMVMIKAQEADALFDARNHALEDWQTSQQGLAAVANRGSALVEAQRRDALVTKAIEMVKSVPASKGQIPAYQVTDPTFVADRDKHETEFRAWVQQAKPEEQFAMMLEGFMGPKTYEMLDHYARENSELKQALYGHARAANPRITAGEPSWTPPPPPKPVAQDPKQSTDGFSVAEPSFGSGEAMIGNIFRTAGIMPPGM